MENKNICSSLFFLFLLISVDIVFIFLSCINILTTLLNNLMFNLGSDRGYPEVYQYIKFFWIILLLLCAMWKYKAVQYIAWVFIFSYFLVDDSLQIHERIGDIISENMDFRVPLGLRVQDIGELMASLFFGIILFIPLFYSYINGGIVFKKISNDMFILIVFLIFFGVFLDVLHVSLRDIGWTFKFILGVIEDGGEMVSVSLLVWYVLRLNIRDDMNNGLIIPVLNCYLPAIMSDR